MIIYNTEPVNIKKISLIILFTCLCLCSVKPQNMDTYTDLDILNFFRHHADIYEGPANHAGLFGASRLSSSFQAQLPGFLDWFWFGLKLSNQEPPLAGANPVNSKANDLAVGISLQNYNDRMLFVNAFGRIYGFGAEIGGATDIRTWLQTEDAEEPVKVNWGAGYLNLYLFGLKLSMLRTGAETAVPFSAAELGYHIELGKYLDRSWLGTIVPGLTWFTGLNTLQLTGEYLNFRPAPGLFFNLAVQGRYNWTSGGFGFGFVRLTNTTRLLAHRFITEQQEEYMTTRFGPGLFNNVKNLSYIFLETGLHYAPTNPVMYGFGFMAGIHLLNPPLLTMYSLALKYYGNFPLCEELPADTGNHILVFEFKWGLNALLLITKDKRG